MYLLTVGNKEYKLLYTWKHYILAILFFIHLSESVSKNDGKQSHWIEFTETLKGDVLSTLSVSSILTCANECVHIKSCTHFDYADSRKECRLIQQSQAILTSTATKVYKKSGRVCIIIMLIT